MFKFMALGAVILLWLFAQSWRTRLVSLAVFVAILVAACGDLRYKIVTSCESYTTEVVYPYNRMNPLGFDNQNVGFTLLDVEKKNSQSDPVVKIVVDTPDGTAVIVGKNCKLDIPGPVVNAPAGRGF